MWVSSELEQNQFTWFWDSRKTEGRSSIIDSLPSQTTSLIFFLRQTKITENCYLRVRNRAQVGSAVTRESVYPSIWCQILLQPVGRMWKPTHCGELSPVNNSCSDRHFLMVFCSMQSNPLESLDQLLVGGTVLTRGSRRRQDASDRVVTNQHGVWFSLGWVLQSAEWHQHISDWVTELLQSNKSLKYLLHFWLLFEIWQHEWLHTSFCLRGWVLCDIP